MKIATFERRNGAIHETAERQGKKRSIRQFQNRSALNYGRGDLDGHGDRGGRG